MTSPGVGTALGLGWRAAVRNAWLAPVGLVAALVRTALAAPAFALALYVMREAAALHLQRGFGIGAATDAALEALTSPRAAARAKPASGSDNARSPPSAWR